MGTLANLLWSYAALPSALSWKLGLQMSIGCASGADMAFKIPDDEKYPPHGTPEA